MDVNLEGFRNLFEVIKGYQWMGILRGLGFSLAETYWRLSMDVNERF